MLFLLGRGRRGREDGGAGVRRITSSRCDRQDADDYNGLWKAAHNMWAFGVLAASTFEGRRAAKTEPLAVATIANNRRISHPIATVNGFFRYGRRIHV